MFKESRIVKKHAFDFVATGEGYKVQKTDGTVVVVINPDGTLNGSTVIDDASITLAKLATAVAPSHVTKFAGEVTWTGGGATLASTVTGVLATDIVVASIHTLGTEGTILQGTVASANTITFTLDAANTTNDTVISYQVLRATA